MRFEFDEEHYEDLEDRFERLMEVEEQYKGLSDEEIEEEKRERFLQDQHYRVMMERY
jgi:hypothetical protein